MLQSGFISEGDSRSNPDEFFEALYELEKQRVDFELIVLGEQFKEYPKIFDDAKSTLRDRIAHWGYLPSRAEYLRALAGCDIVVSTAVHEFFGIAVMEAVRTGCYPMLPDRLAYRELFPEKMRYENGQLVSILERNIANIDSLRAENHATIAKAYEWPRWIEKYCELLQP